MTPRGVHAGTSRRLTSAMLSAMRADPEALARAGDSAAPPLAPFTQAFLNEARTLVLATTAALTTVLRIHRYGAAAYGPEVCLACGTDHCRTVRATAEALTAYEVAVAPVDRAEAWRRADAWYTGTAGHPVLVSIEDFEAGFIARPASDIPGHPDSVLIIDRATGALTRWPALDTATLIGNYRRPPDRPHRGPMP